MRILHTSDWHLGRSLHGQSLLEGQAAFVDFLVDVVRTEAIDVVLVAGDLYDRAIPPVEAVELFSRALSRIAALGTPIILTSGNHDSAARLGFGTELIAAAGVHLRTDPARVAEPIVLADHHGPVAIYPLPYLEPELTWSALGAAAARHEAVLAAAMQAVRRDVADRAPGTRVVVMAHAFVAGAAEARPSDSERDISVGGSALAAASVFEGVHYAALGHLHQFQQPVPGRIVYSGSPLAYSFSEEGQTKSVTVVDLAADGSTTLEQIPCPVLRPLARLRGSLHSLLVDERWTAYEHHWLAVTLTDAELPIEPMDRLRARFPGVLQLTVTAHRSGAEGSYVERLEGLDDLGLVGRFIEDMWNRSPSTDELALVRAGFEAQRIREVRA
ncbi:MAG: exonuclease SbcCD subunit D [Acidimicrobiales bacterium]